MFIPTNKPPLLYNLLMGIINEKGEKINDIFDVPRVAAKYVFNFQYPLSDNINKADFESNILTRYISRRIGQETYTAFKFALHSKLNEIMPHYNKLFDMLDGWDIFADGESVTTDTERKYDDIKNDKTVTDGSSKSTGKNVLESKQSNTLDSRQSKTPQSAISDVKNGTYVSNYTFDTNDTSVNDTTNTYVNGANNSTTRYDGNANGKEERNEKIRRTVSDKIGAYRQFKNDLESIYTSLYKELDVLFYGLI